MSISKEKEKQKEIIEIKQDIFKQAANKNSLPKNNFFHRFLFFFVKMKIDFFFPTIFAIVHFKK